MNKKWNYEKARGEENKKAIISACMLNWLKYQNNKKDENNKSKSIVFLIDWWAQFVIVDWPIALDLA